MPDCFKSNKVSGCFKTNPFKYCKIKIPDCCKSSICKDETQSQNQEDVDGVDERMRKAVENNTLVAPNVER